MGTFFVILLVVVLLACAGTVLYIYMGLTTLLAQVNTSYAQIEPKLKYKYDTVRNILTVLGSYMTRAEDMKAIEQIKKDCATTLAGFNKGIKGYGHVTKHDAQLTSHLHRLLGYVAYHEEIVNHKILKREMAELLLVEQDVDKAYDKLHEHIELYKATYHKPLFEKVAEMVGLGNIE